MKTLQSLKTRSQIHPQTRNPNRAMRAPRPTGFRVKLQAPTGTRIAGQFRWQTQAILA